VRSTVRADLFVSFTVYGILRFRKEPWLFADSSQVRFMTQRVVV